jgi:hypothetical protein
MNRSGFQKRGGQYKKRGATTSGDSGSFLQWEVKALLQQSDLSVAQKEVLRNKEILTR